MCHHKIKLHDTNKNVMKCNENDMADTLEGVRITVSGKHLW